MTKVRDTSTPTRLMKPRTPSTSIGRVAVIRAFPTAPRSVTDRKLRLSSESPMSLIGTPRLANDAAARLRVFTGLSDHLTSGAVKAIVDALLRPDAREMSETLLEMIEAHRPGSLRPPLEMRIRAAGEVAPPIFYAALGALDGRLDEETIRSLLARASPEAREIAARHAAGPTARRLLRDLMRNDRAPAVPAAVVTRLVRLEGVAALCDVTGALEDRAAPVRLSAVRAAASLDPEAIESVRSIAIRDPSDAAKAAVSALSLMGREAHEVLAELATEHPDEGMRVLAQIAIGQPIGDRH